MIVKVIATCYHFFFAYLCGLYAFFKGGDSNDSKFFLYLAVNNMMHLQVY